MNISENVIIFRLHKLNDLLSFRCVYSKNILFTNNELSTLYLVQTIALNKSGRSHSDIVLTVDFSDGQVSGIAL